MRIAYDYQTFTLQSYGGISRYFTKLADELTKMDQDVRIFSPIHRNNYALDLPDGVVRGRYVRRFPPKSIDLIKKVNQLLATRSINKWKPNIVHETYYSSISVAPHACPIVVTVHDMIHELFPENFAITDNTTFEKFQAIHRADIVICVSENTKKDLIGIAGIQEEKIRVIHHGFDGFRDCIMRSKIAVIEKPYLLYVGNRSGYKNFSEMLKAISYAHKLKRDFNIIAFGGPEFSPSEVSLISSLGFSTGQVKHQSGSDDELGALYRGARAFIYPSLYEGFGIPTLEAMAHECPVVSSNSSSLPEIVGLAGQYFSPRDADEMRHAIETVVYSDERVAELRQAGLSQISKFSWEKCARETLNIYRLLS
jgi:glycosyltransferase involved in cell wall biosynthesis